jgi:hypothetical protein
VKRVRAIARCRVSRMLVAICSLLTVDVNALANQVEADTRASPTGGVMEPDSPAQKRAVIVLVGPVSEDPSLRALLAELLNRSGIQSRFVRQSSLPSEQILTSARGDPSVWVFISVRDRHDAELLFRDPTGERFLLREFALPRGIDDVGREGLGQVVESAVVTLFSTEEGLSREQAKALIERHAPKPASASTMPRDEPTNPNSFQTFGWLAPRYEVGFAGSKIGFGHGPGLELGLGRRSRRFWRLRLGYCRWFSQSIDTTLVKARLSTQKIRAAIDLGVGLSPSSWVVFGLGASGDLTWISPEASKAPSVELGRAHRDFVPAATAEVRYEIGWKEFAAGFAISATIPLTDTHYDLSRPSGIERQANLARLGLGTAVILAYQPSFGDARLGR